DDVQHAASSRGAPLKDFARAADRPRGQRSAYRPERGGEEPSMDVNRRWGTRAAIAAMACALTLLRAVAGHAAIAVDSTSNASGNTVSTLAWSHTVGSGSGRVLVVGVSNRDGNKTV